LRSLIRFLSLFVCLRLPSRFTLGSFTPFTFGLRCVHSSCRSFARSLFTLTFCLVTLFLFCVPFVRCSLFVLRLPDFPSTLQFVGLVHGCSHWSAFLLLHLRYYTDSYYDCSGRSSLPLFYGELRCPFSYHLFTFYSGYGFRLIRSFVLHGCRSFVAYVCLRVVTFPHVTRFAFCVPFRSCCSGVSFLRCSSLPFGRSVLEFCCCLRFSYRYMRFAIVRLRYCSFCCCSLRVTVLPFGVDSIALRCRNIGAVSVASLVHMLIPTLPALPLPFTTVGFCPDFVRLPPIRRTFVSGCFNTLPIVHCSAFDYVVLPFVRLGEFTDLRILLHSLPLRWCPARFCSPTVRYPHLLCTFVLLFDYIPVELLFPICSLPLPTLTLPLRYR